MELGSVLLLTFVSLVSASPYGYGVKGGAGAVAKAEASATAGAISGIGAVPVAFPALAGGYSGSYSKSSSSSFASSSASASSGSFSFNGDSTGGSAGSGSSLGSYLNNESEGKAGCGSDCSGGGVNYLGTSGNGLQSHSGPNAAAGAGGVVGLPSFTTYGASQPCLSGDCSNQTPYSCTGSSCISEKKCSSGHCGSSLPISYSTSDLGTYNPDGQSLSYNKDTSNYFYSNCAQGNCATNPKSTNYEYNNQKPICNTPDCSNINTHNSESSNFKKAFVNSNTLNIPETYLNTPNDGSGLYSVECAGTSCQKKIFQNLPSSYNVPSYTVTASDLETPKCYSENCDSEKSQDSYNPSAYYENKPQGTTKYGTETRCTSSNCAESAEDIEVTKSYSATTERPATIGCEAGNCAAYPSGIKPSFTPNDKEINNCGTTNCESGKPTYPAYKPNYSSTPFPSYTFAASGAASNVYASSDSTSSMNLIHATGSDNDFKPTSQNKNSLPWSVSPTYTQPSTIGTHLVPSSGTSHNIPTANILFSPGASSSSYYIAPSASYNPSSIQPTKGNTYQNSFSPKNTYNTAPESSGSYYFPTTNTISKETSNSAPLSSSYYSTTPSSIGHVSPSIKPSSNAPSSISSNYTPSSGSFIPASKSPTYKIPTTSTGYTFSNTGSVAASGSNSESHTHITSQPSSLVTHKPAVYMGSFGGPPGLLLPNDYTVPQKPVSAQQRPFVQQPYSTTTTLSPSKLIEKGPLPCSSGNCKHSSGHYGHASSSSDTDAKSIAYTGGFGGAPGFLSPSSSIINQTPTLSTKPSVTHAADASASSNAVIYTGGFGGPPGILKPHDSNNIGSSLVVQSSPHYGNVPKGISNTPHIDVLTGVSTQSGAPGGANIGDFIQSGSPSSSQPSTGSGKCTGGTNCGLAYDGGNINQANSPIGAFASGAASANAVAASSSGPTYNSRHDYSSDSKHGTGCKGGCGDNHYDSGYGGYGLSNSGSYSTDLGRDFGVVGATAKSFGSASGSGVGSYGYGGSFASSSAHASAGAGTKGGYGRR